MEFRGARRRGAGGGGCSVERQRDQAVQKRISWPLRALVIYRIVHSA
jgi:hypothetical protein